MSFRVWTLLAPAGASDAIATVAFAQMSLTRCITPAKRDDAFHDVQRKLPLARLPTALAATAASSRGACEVGHGFVGHVSATSRSTLPPRRVCSTAFFISERR